MRVSRMIAAACCAALTTGPFPVLAQTAPVMPPGAALVRLKPATTILQFNGTFTITATLAANPQMPNGTTVNYNASVSTYDASFTNSHATSGSATVNGGSITINVGVPYTFLVSSTSDTIHIGLNASATVAAAETFNFSTAFSTTVPLPANGANTPVTFSGAM